MSDNFRTVSDDGQRFFEGEKVRTRASFLGHPIHPTLVHFPMGLLSASFFFDLMGLWRGGQLWGEIAFYNLALGLAGAWLAAIPGFVDYVSLNDEKALLAAHWHFGVNLALLAVYSLDFWLRIQPHQNGANAFPLAPFLLSALGVLLLGLSGRLGGELVYVHDVGSCKRAARNVTLADNP